MSVHGEDWAELSADAKMDHRYRAWLETPAPFVSGEAEVAYRQRVERLSSAMRLQGLPDRVPVPLCVAEGYAVSRAGLTPYDAMYDFDSVAEAFVEFHREIQPDGMVSPLGATLPGRAFELIDYKLYSWPGHGVPRHAGYQYNEAEWMLADEYDGLVADPSDFLLRTYLPRIASGLSGFRKLGTVLDPGVMVFSTGFFASLADPEVIASLQNAAAAGAEVLAWHSKLFPLMSRLAGEGFPPFFQGATEAPFDYLGDNLRGTKEVLMDLHRRPEDVLAACDRLAPLMVRWVTEKATADNCPGVFIPLHKGADGFMSLDQFKSFYWPSLLKVIQGLNEEGFTPILFAEGAYGSRLETIAADLPPGKSVWYFDRTDMGRVKETVGKVACIQGNVPLTLLHAGTTEEVAEYCRQLLHVAAPGGGFILDIGAVMQQGNEANLRAMIRAVHEYGVYR